MPVVHILSNKFIKGGEPVDGTATLTQALLEPWACDAHCTMYTTTDNVRALKAQAESYDITFEVAMIDLDFDGHGRKPNVDDFREIEMLAGIMDFVPNLIYQTRGGCRWVFVIEPIRSAEAFEARYQVLIDKLSVPVGNGAARHGYKVDTCAKDWTRLFRLPHIERDGVEEFDHEIRWLHNDRLNLANFEVAAKTQHRRAIGTGHYDGNDLTLLRLLRGDMLVGRNTATYRAARHCFEKYKGADLEAALDAVREAAGAATGSDGSAGLSEREIETTINSASVRGKDNDK